MTLQIRLSNSFVGAARISGKRYGGPVPALIDNFEIKVSRESFLNKPSKFDSDKYFLGLAGPNCSSIST